MIKKTNFFLQHRWFETLTIVMGFLGNASPYLQAYKIFALKSAYAVSFYGNLIGLISSTFWFLYGYSRKIKPLILCNIMGILGLILVVIGILVY